MIPGKLLRRLLTRLWEEASIELSLLRLRCPSHEAWSIARANEIMYQHRTNLCLTLELANVPRLADSWVEELRERAERLHTPVAEIGASSA